MPIFYTNTGSLGTLQVSGSTIVSASTSNLVRIAGSGSSILSVSGSIGPLLEISDANPASSKLFVFSSASIEILSIDRNKRVDISGSLVVTGSITGSLLGTASYALSALTASFALNAGSSTGDKISSGSVSASVNVGNADTFRIISASSTFVYVSASGNVGIGTTNPQGKLDVNGDSFITGSTRITGSLAVVGNLTVSTGSGTFDRGLFVTRSFKVVDQALLNSFEANPDGNVVTSTNLDVTHNVRESVDAFVIYDTLNSRTAFRYNNEGLNFIIDPASQNSISIGKQSDPTAKLDISGSVKITGSLDVTSTENVATFRVRNPSLGETNILFVTSSGRVAVNGSLPTARFQVGGVVSGDYIFRAVTNTGTTLLAVTGSRIGVGTENPEESFHVSAASKFTQNVSVTASLVVSGANGAGIFSQGATLVDYLGGITNSASYMVWRAPFSCSAVALYGYYVGGTSPQVNAFRSGSSGIGRLTGSNLTLSNQNVWTQAIVTGLQNTEFNAGDSLQVVISGSSNNQVAVQVDFIRKF